MAHSNLPVISHPHFPQDPLSQLAKFIADTVLPPFFEQVIDRDPQAHIAWRAEGNQILIKGVHEADCDQLAARLQAALPSFIHVTKSFKPYLPLDKPEEAARG